MNSDNSANVGIAILICIISTLGVLLNGFGLIIVSYNPILANAFGRLCFSHCIANFGVSFVFLVWVAPLTITQDEGLSTSLFGKILGQISIFFWDVCVYSHLSISINRFISITFPLKAAIYITSLRSAILVALPWLLGFFHIVPYFFYNECFISYHPSTWTWDFAQTQCGLWISKYFDMYSGFTVFTIMAFLDLTTLYFLHRNHQYVNDTIFDERRVFEAVQVAKNKRTIEIRFFIQSCVQGGIFFYELSNFYVFCEFHNNKYYVFFTTTFAWVLCHMLDGLVLCSFHVKSYQRQRRGSVTSQRLFRT